MGSQQSSDRREELTVLIEHARFYWEAEEENSSRGHRDRQANLTVILAFVAVVGGAFIRLAPEASGMGLWIAGILGCMSAATFLAAFCYLVVRRPTNRDDDGGLSATWDFQLPSEVIELQSDRHEIFNQCFLSSYNAAQTLAAKNERFREKLRWASLFMVFGLAFGLLAITILLFS